MVGGEKADFEAALPVFQAMGKTITHLGPLGAGGFTKLANQIIVAVNLTALGEALTLARKAGLDRALTLKALGGGLAASRCLEQKTPNYVSGTYKPGFKIDLHFKDLGLIMEASRALGVPLPATADGAGTLQCPPRARQGRPRPLRRHHACSRSWPGWESAHEGDGGPARARFPGSLAAHQDPPRPQGRPREGPRRHRAGVRRLLRAPGRHAAAPGVRRGPVRPPPLAHGAVGLLRGRGGGRARSSAPPSPSCGAPSGVVGPIAVLTNYQNQDIGQQLLAGLPGVLRREQGRRHGALDVSLQPEAPDALPEVRLPAAGPGGGHREAPRPARDRPRDQAGQAGSQRAPLLDPRGGQEEAGHGPDPPHHQRRVAGHGPREGSGDRRRPGARRHAAPREGARRHRLRHLPPAARTARRPTAART